MPRSLTLEEDRQCRQWERDLRAEIDLLTALRRTRFDVNARIGALKVALFQLEQSLRTVNALPQSLERRPHTFMLGLMAEIAIARRRGQIEDAIGRKRQNLLDEERRLQGVELDIGASEQGIRRINALGKERGCQA